MNRRILTPTVLAPTLLASALLLTACGSSSSSGLIDSSSPAATGSAAASGSAASGAWAVSQCAQIQPPTAADAPVGKEVTTGIAVDQKTPADAPVISIGATAQPATALGSYDLVPGTGAEVSANATVTANYCGVGLTSRTVFDSSWARGGQPISFPLAGVIAGWTQGLPGMKVGGTRVLVIPGDLGYGPNPPGGSGIQPDETLVFVVSLTATK